MRLAEVRNIIHQVIAEVKKEKTKAKKKPEVKSKMGSNLPKSSGKLADLKQEMKVLKQMKESLGQLQITEGDDSQFVAEYAHMQKYVNELESIKSAHTKLSEMLDNQIEQVNERIQSETAKVKEMMGLGEKPNMKDEAKKAKKIKKDEVNEEMDLGSNLRSLSSKIKDAFENGDEITVNGKKITKVYGGNLTTEEGKKIYLSELPNDTDIKIDGQKIKFDFKKNKEDQATTIRNSGTKLDENSFSSMDAILKAAKAAIEAGETVTVDGKKISRVITAAGAFTPVDGSSSLKIKNYLNNMSAIKIGGKSVELKASAQSTHTRVPDPNRYGDRTTSVRGKYTGD